MLVVLLWFWIASFLGDDDEDPGDAASGTVTIELPTFSSTEEPTTTGNMTPSAPAVATTPVPGGGSATTPATTNPAEPTTDTGGNPDVGPYLGATVEVANTDGAGVNVRADATTSADILTVFLDGTQVTVIDGPVEAEGFTWWQITGNEVAAGWIVQEYLVVVE
ncbi:MAG: SH3 domain-containing protein [Thermomicrobiales bacterium]